MLPKNDADNEAQHFVATKAYHSMYQMLELFVITLVATIHPQPLDL